MKQKEFASSVGPSAERQGWKPHNENMLILQGPLAGIPTSKRK